MEIKKKRLVGKKAEKVIVTQDNRFVYAKYNMNANEMKFFMWIIAQINSQEDTLFQRCEIPLNEVIQVWKWKETSDDNHAYIKNLVNKMSEKVYIEDFRLLDEKTMEEVDIYETMPIFQFIRYRKGKSYIEYRLSDYLMDYLLNLKRDFTQLKFDDIQDMKSAYSIRIYNMLVCELKQNRQSFKMSLVVLQNILEVPKSFETWKDFNRRVLEQAQKDINSKSNIVLLEIKTFKTGRKITILEFVFDYKNNNKRITRDSEKQKSFNLALANAVSAYIGKKVFFKDYGELICLSWKWVNDDEKEIVANFERASDKKSFYMKVKAFKDINAICRARDRAEEMFYLDTEKVKEAIEFRKQVQSGNLFKKILKN